MGALVSLPLAPIGWAASCCGAATCSAFCSSIGGTFKSSIMTRLTYAMIFLVNSLLSWIVLSPFIVNKLERLSFGLINLQCNGDQCTAFTAVHRINFALGIWHVILGILLLNVKSTANPRATIQNGVWKLKVFAWVAFICLTFLIPDSFFIFWGNHIAIIFSTLFIGIGLILLVDFAHAWAEKCLEKIEYEDSAFWKNLLVGGTLTMYLTSIVLTILMYIFFAGSHCSMNQAAITINLVFALIISGMSINQTIQEFNPQAGLAQSSMVCVYGTYLIMSAVSTEPDDKSCNPLIRSRGTRTASIVLGAFFTFIAMAYTTTRAAANSAFSDFEETPEESGVISAQPRRNEMRIEAIRQAVDEGSLPESALTQAYLYDSDEEEHGGEIRTDEERKATKYNYSLFHIVFFMATQWTATLLTMNVQRDDSGDFVPVGRTYFNSWVKIVSSWVCYALYGWSLAAPVLFPDRFGIQI